MPKAGTTSLHRYLSEHPDTCMALDKEPHYFSVDLLQEGADFTVIPNILGIPHLRITTRCLQSVVCYCSRGVIVFYLFSQAAAKEIYEYNSDAKIIIMLREPVAFLYSLHSQGLYSGNETETDFALALELEAVRRQGEHLPSTVHFPSRLFYRDHWRITEQIKRFVDTFGTSQVRVIVFDDFKSDTETEVGWINFLDSIRIITEDNHNANTAMRSKRLARYSRSESSDYFCS